MLPHVFKSLPMLPLTKAIACKSARALVLKERIRCVMSNQVFPDVGEQRLLQVIKDGSGTFKIRLFKTLSGSPGGSGTVVGDFTEPTGTWYASQSFSWDNPTIVSNKGTIVSTAAKTFSYSGASSAEVILGYFITEDGGARSNQVVSFEIFDSSVTMQTSGDTITITPKMTANSEA